MARNEQLDQAMKAIQQLSISELQNALMSQLSKLDVSKPRADISIRQTFNIYLQPNGEIQQVEQPSLESLLQLFTEPVDQSKPLDAGGAAVFDPVSGSADSTPNVKLTPASTVATEEAPDKRGEDTAMTIDEPKEPVKFSRVGTPIVDHELKMKDFELRDSRWLTAQCQQPHQASSTATWPINTIDLNDYLENQEGEFAWVKHGNYIATAKCVELEVDGDRVVLHALLRTSEGFWKEAKVSLDQAIGNIEGQMEVEDYAFDSDYEYEIDEDDEDDY